MSILFKIIAVLAVFSSLWACYLQIRLNSTEKSLSIAESQLKVKEGVLNDWRQKALESSDKLQSLQKIKANSKDDCLNKPITDNSLLEQLHKD